MKISPPRHLAPPERRWWSAMVKEVEIDDVAGLAVLTLAAERKRRAREAREMLDREGIVLRDRFGQAVPHPAAAIERGAITQLLACLKALNLDVEPLQPRPGRPAGDFNFGG